MIALDSKSYPYLAVAQHYNIEYGEVLNYVNFLEKTHNTNPPYSKWRLSVIEAYQNEMERRKGV